MRCCRLLGKWSIFGIETTHCRLHTVSPHPHPHPNFICWNPKPKKDGFIMWGLWNVTRLWEWSSYNMISAFIRRDERACFLSVYCLPHEGTERRQLSTSQEEVPFQKLTLISDLPVSRTAINKFLLFKSPCLCYLVIAPGNDWHILVFKSWFCHLIAVRSREI